MVGQSGNEFSARTRGLTLALLRVLPQELGHFLPISYVIASQDRTEFLKSVPPSFLTDHEESLFPGHKMANGLERTPLV